MKIKNSLTGKLSLVIILVLSGFILINLFLYSQLNLAMRRLDTTFASNVSINDLSDTLGKYQDTVYEYLNTKSSKALENYYRYELEYEELLEGLNPYITDNEARLLERSIRNMSETYLEEAATAVAAKRGRNVEKYKEAYAETQLLHDYIEEAINQLNNLRFRNNSENYLILRDTIGVLERISGAILVGMSLISVLLAGLLIRQMTHPLLTLTRAVNEIAGGNLDVPKLPIRSEDEIGIVTSGFNQMVESLKLYIEQQRESLEKEASLKERELMMEAHLKEAQLQYLQAQINPHFLFNSLNAGMQLAFLEDADRTGIFLERMADFFRYNTQKMQGVVTLEEEIETVDNYIYILNVRFAGDISYEKQIEGAIDDVLLPGMILQPIVENAMQHGIHDCMDTGWIHLLIRREEDYVQIRVEDNGAGMTQEQIRAVMRGDAQQLEQSENKGGIAVYNVAQRLALYFKQEDLLAIESEGPGMGTAVTIRIPCTDREENDV